MSNFPVQITIPNAFDKSAPPDILKAVGIGSYPYECLAQKQHPKAMVYKNETCWTYSMSVTYLIYRDQSKDVFSEAAIVCKCSSRFCRTEHTFGGNWKYDEQTCQNCGRRWRKYKKRGEFEQIAPDKRILKQQENQNVSN